MPAAGLGVKTVFLMVAMESRGQGGWKGGRRIAPPALTDAGAVAAA